MAISLNYADNTFIFRFDKSLGEIIENDLYKSLREEIRETCSSDFVKQKIHEEIVKAMAGAETKEVLTRMIAEVVSETIKTTIMELKQQGVI